MSYNDLSLPLNDFDVLSTDIVFALEDALQTEYSEEWLT